MDSTGAMLSAGPSPGSTAIAAAAAVGQRGEVGFADMAGGYTGWRGQRKEGVFLKKLLPSPTAARRQVREAQQKFFGSFF
jgi:hypothetical protein